MYRINESDFTVYVTSLFSNSGYIASNERMVGEWWIGNDVDESSRGIIKFTIPAT
jgi:hypothetical protein